MPLTLNKNEGKTKEEKEKESPVYAKKDSYGGGEFCYNSPPTQIHFNLLWWELFSMLVLHSGVLSFSLWFV